MMTNPTELRIEGYYRTLDLSNTASLEEVERQYQRLIRLYEPEKLDNPEDRTYAEEKRTEIERAYKGLVKELQDRPDEEIFFCANHPERETLLRCNKCGKPICMECAVQTPVGYRCKECVRQQQNVYFNAATSDNLIAFGVGLAVSAIAAPIVGTLIGFFGFWGFIIAFLAGSAAGSALAQIIRQAVGRRRGRRLPLFALIGIIMGVLLGNVGFLLVTGFFPLFTLPMILFTILALAAAYPQLR
jgi:hypothetical protein